MTIDEQAADLARWVREQCAELLRSFGQKVRRARERGWQ